MDSLFDIKLIKEFEKCPAFYDRNCINFKNKQFLNDAWENIAQKLGYRASLLKDRMLQLRNRFNLEKRKLEAARNESGQNAVISTWPLFECMSFLEGHIRPRKSYKMIMKEMEYKKTNGEIVETGNLKDCYDTDDQTQSDDDVHFVYDSNKEENFTENHCDETNVAHFMVPEMTEMSSPLPPPPPMKRRKVNYNQLDNSILQGSSSNYFYNLSSSPKNDKYQKFGQFIASFLSDPALPEEQALNLIEKFTLDIVNTMKNNISKQSPQN